MNVKELIEQLQKLDPEAVVYIPDQHYGEEGTMSWLQTVEQFREYTSASYVELGLV